MRESIRHGPSARRYIRRRTDEGVINKAGDAAHELWRVGSCSLVDGPFDDLAEARSKQNR